jgi:hypothetical protein
VTGRRWSATDWSLLLAIAVVTSVLLLQNTKQALLPAKETAWLWAAELAGIAALLVLRSGWGRDAAWAREQRDLGTLANDFYEPRREALINGGAVAGGVFTALWWATATWSVMFYGMRRGVPTRGLIDFSTAALVGAITGGLVGAAIGLGIGHVWERRHRQRRRERERRSHA